jgi:hypothetical protein
MFLATEVESSGTLNGEAGCDMFSASKSGFLKSAVVRFREEKI